MRLLQGKATKKERETMYTQCDWCGNDATNQMTTEPTGTYDFCADCTESIIESAVAA